MTHKAASDLFCQPVPHPFKNIRLFVAGIIGQHCFSKVAVDRAHWSAKLHWSLLVATSSTISSAGVTRSDGKYFSTEAAGMVNEGNSTFHLMSDLENMP